MSLRNAALVTLALASALALSAPADAAGGKGKARVDANGDGKISLQEFLTRRGRIFDRMDANHDGQVTKDEVAVFQTRMENASAGAMIRSGKARDEGAGGGKQIERLLERTANGSISRAQWDAMMTKRFQRLDVAATGFIGMDQMRPGRAGATADPMAPAAPKP